MIWSKVYSHYCLNRNIIDESITVFSLDHSENPYKPTYTFPDEFNGDPDHMEDYIRKKATQTIDQNDRKRVFESEEENIISYSL